MTIYCRDSFIFFNKKYYGKESWRLALFKILNNFGTSNSITSLTSHNAGYCYFDINTNKFYIDTTDNAAGLR